MIVRSSHTDLEPARCARFGTGFASNLDRGLGGQLGEPLPDVGGELTLHEDRLTDARPVAKDGKGDLARGAEMRDPCADHDGLAGVVGKLGDADEWNGRHDAGVDRVARRLRPA